MTIVTGMEMDIMFVYVGIIGYEAVKPDMGTERSKGSLRGPGSRKDSNHRMVKDAWSAHLFSFEATETKLSLQYFLHSSITHSRFIVPREITWLAEVVTCPAFGFTRKRTLVLLPRKTSNCPSTMTTDNREEVLF